MLSIEGLRASASLIVLKRYRRLLIAAGVTLLVSLSLLGFVALAKWHGRKAIENDTQTIIEQAGGQLVRSLQSRRGTLTLLRDALQQSPNFNAAQLKAFGGSAVNHTRHLLAVGSIIPQQPPEWWSGPFQLTRTEQSELNDAVYLKMQARGAWRTPGTFVVAAQSQGRMLIMVEPLRRSQNEPKAILGAFHLDPLLRDFFTSGTLEGFPFQLLSGTDVLYRSSDWAERASGQPPVIAQHAIPIDAIRWTLQMQPGANRVNQTLSWLTFSLVALSVIAGFGISFIVWILAARAWILQRAVTRRTAALRRSLARVRQLATTDELTGLYNRRFFLRRWAWECDRAKRYQRPLACLMVDINDFKQVNDRLGHLAGDFVLKQVAQELRNLLRQSDIIARFGGDEFVVALPETTLAQAESVVEKLKQLRISAPEGSREIPPVSLSVGASQPLNGTDQPEDLLETADQALYANKLERKNRLSSAQSGLSGDLLPLKIT